MPTFRLSAERADTIRADLVAVPVFSGAQPGPGASDVAKALGVELKQLLEENRVKGELGDTLVVLSLGRMPAKQVLFLGLGDKASAGARRIRKAAAAVARRAGNAGTIATTIAQAGRGSAEELAAAFVEGFLLGSYRFERYKASNEDRPAGPSAVLLIGGRNWETRKANTGATRGRILAEATALARDLTNTPAMDKSPQSLADEARRIARNAGGLSVRVLDEKQLESGGYGGLLGVGRGSRKPPRLVEVSYAPSGAKRHVALVGKGITFDSGGLDIKTQGMDWMKTDMAGAAAVLGAMQAIAKLKPRVAVTAVICTAENMPGGNAMHPGDVLKIRGGKTVEVGNTDAEGRLVIGDGIVHAKEKGAEVIVDVATLTGACMIALGSKYFGVFSNDSKLARDLTGAAERAGELAWTLPLAKEYRKEIDSDIADLRNIGTGRYGGAITAALFLAEFAGDARWAHLDIAGPARSEAEDYEVSKGATGAGVRTLVEWVTSLEARR